jgi:hypothetical protein
MGAQGGGFTLRIEADDGSSFRRVEGDKMGCPSSVLGSCTLQKLGGCHAVVSRAGLVRSSLGDSRSPAFEEPLYIVALC